MLSSLIFFVVASFLVNFSRFRLRLWVLLVGWIVSALSSFLWRNLRLPHTRRALLRPNNSVIWKRSNIFLSCVMRLHYDAIFNIVTSFILNVNFY